MDFDILDTCVQKLLAVVDLKAVLASVSAALKGMIDGTVTRRPVFYVQTMTRPDMMLTDHSLERLFTNCVSPSTIVGAVGAGEAARGGGSA